MPFSRSPKFGRTEKGHFRNEHSKFHYFCRTGTFFEKMLYFWNFWALFVSRKVIDWKCASFCWKWWICWIMLGRMFQKMCVFLLKCWICWICWIILGLWTAKGTTRGKIIQHIQHFIWKRHFFKNMVLSGEMIQHSPKSGYFRGKNSTCVSNVLLSAEMLNMLNHVGSNFRKMCFFLLKCWICWIIFGSMESQKGPNRGKLIQHIHIFNISAERSTFLGKGIQHDLTYSTFQQKEAHFWKKCFFLGKNSTWPKKWLFQGEILQHSPQKWLFHGIYFNMCIKMCFFLLKCWIC